LVIEDSAEKFSWLVADPVLDFAALELAAQERRREYRQAQPCRHIHWRGFIDEGLQTAVAAELTPGTQGAGHADLGPATRELVWELSSGSFLRVLRLLTGDGQLLPDPGLFGGCIQTLNRDGGVSPGGVSSVHPRYQLLRQLSLQLVISGHWRPEWGGHSICEHSDQRDTLDLGVLDRGLAPGDVLICDETAQLCAGAISTSCPASACQQSLILHYYRKGEQLAPGEE
jgi:hypothetical protein